MFCNWREREEEEDCYCQAPGEGEQEEEEEEGEADGSPDCGEAAYLPLAVHLQINGTPYAKNTQFPRCTRTGGKHGATPAKRGREGEEEGREI